MKRFSNVHRKIGILFLMAVFVAIVSGVQKLNHLFSPPDTDVSGVPAYNFSAFAGTMWTNKTVLAYGELKDYRGRTITCLLAPDSFDETHPDYSPVAGFRLKRLVPVGTRIKIMHLMRDNGIGGGIDVTATMYSEKTAEEIGWIDNGLFLPIRFLGGTEDPTATNWDCRPELLGRCVRNPIP